ncbi:MAG: Na+/H+ antiporter subunit E [Steroidobacteraceae bacterium]
MRATLTLLLLGVTWLLWSGIYEPVILALGLLSCLLALFLAHRMGFFTPGIFSLHVSSRLPRFWAWLLVEIVKANLAVAAAVLRPRRSISPTVVEIRTRAGPIGQTLLANAITLTPGTVTLDVDEGRLRVHCLTRAAADALLAGDMSRRVASVTAD